MKIGITTLTLLLIMQVLSACSSTIELTQLRFESPEVIGQGQHQAAISFNAQQRVKVAIKSTADFAKPTITTEQPANPPQFPSGVSPTNIPVFELYYWARDSLAYLLSTGQVASYAGVNDSLDIYMDTQYGQPLLRAKYQMLGDPASRATAGNFSLALDGGYGFAPFDGIKGLESTAVDLAIISGYRITDRLMIYGGPFQTRYDIKDARGPSSTSVSSDGANVGMRYNFGKDEANAIYLEKSSSVVSSGASEHKGDYYGVSVEFRN